MQNAIKLSPAEQTLLGHLRDAGDDVAAQRFEQSGLPNRRVEEYHYSDLKMLLRAVPEARAALVEDPGTTVAFDGIARITIANGALVAPAGLPEGLTVTTAKAGPTTGSDPMAQINAALAGEAVHITVAPGADVTLHIDRRTEGEAAVSADQVAIEVGKGARAFVVETFGGSDAAHMVNAATSLDVADEANATHVQIDRQALAVTQFVNNRYELGANANLRTLTVNTGAGFNRVNVFGHFGGGDTHADFGGLNLLEGKQHADITLDVTHAVPDTTSTELFKSVCRGDAKGIFQGKINVAKDAQKTDAKMMSQGLLLSEGAEIHTKPELEIFADDVICGHGATCGELDDNALFYLMSRGIPRVEAEAMLIRAFLDELFEPLENEPVTDYLETIVGDWLAAAAASEGK
jgi:Fe-S cluster assembly protein SufD